MSLPFEPAGPASVAPAGLSSSEVEDEEQEVTKEWDSLFRFRAGPEQPSKYLEHTTVTNTVTKTDNCTKPKTSIVAMLPLHT